MEIRKLKVNGIEYEFVCVWSSTRSGFKHSVSLFKNNCPVSEGVCHYINRTWECFSYQTAMLTAIQNELNSIKDRLMYFFKRDNNYTKLTDKRKQEFEKILNTDSNYLDYTALYAVVSDYDKFYKYQRRNKNEIYN